LDGFFSYKIQHTMLLHQALTEQILDAFYEVYNELGYGFLEKVYQNALYFELKDRGFDAIPQRRCAVHYKTREVGEYFTDIIVNNLIILELKACETIRDEHEIQLQNYLKASNLEVGFVLNFGKEPEFSREIFTNDRKNIRRKKI
jgi:GxxExxY protein